MQTISFVPVNLHRCWPREWKRSIQLVLQQNKSHVFPARCTVPLFLFIVFYFIRFGNYWQGHRNSMTPITAGPQQSLPPWEIDYHTGDYVPYSLRTVCGFFNVPQNLYMKGFWDGAYGLSSLSEKTRKSNRVQMSLQRKHFLLSYLKNVIRNPEPEKSCLWLWNPKLSIKNAESC